MKITIKIYNEDGIDPIALLGDILINDGKNIIEAECIYLDSFLCSLIQGVIILKRGKSSSIDLVEEHYPLKIVTKDEIIEISYLQSTVTIHTINELEIELIGVIKYLLGNIEINSESLKIPKIKFMKDFIKKKKIQDSDFVQPVIKEW